MTTWLAAVLLCFAQAAPPRCPDGQPPVLTGHPFRPLDCPPPQERKAADAASPTALPDAKDAERADLGPLDGRWRGKITFMGVHYEVELESAGGGRTLRWSEKDLLTHQLRKLTARTRARFWSKAPPLKAAVACADLPEAELAATVWLGAAPLEEGKSPALDRLAVWTYAGRPETHRVRYAVDGERLRGEYSVDAPKTGAQSASFELSRAKP